MASDEELKEVVTRRIAHFTRKPETAIYRPKVSSKHVSGLYTETTVRDHMVKSDYAEAAGGTNQAPNPIELLLAALCSCIEAAFYEFAVHEGLTINNLSVEAEGMIDLRGLFMVDDSVTPGFQELKYTFRIDSPDDEEKVRALAEKVISHCPVADSLVRQTRISGAIEIASQR